MSQDKAIETVPETIPPVSGERRRQTQPMFNTTSSVARPMRTPTQPGLSAPPPPPSVGERVLRAVGLTRRPVRAPR